MPGVTSQVEVGLVPDNPTTGGRVAGPAALAAVLHGLFDLVTWYSRWTRPPYLRLEDMPEMFSMLSPLGVSIATSAVSGVIAGLAIAGIEPAPGRRATSLGLVLAGFWFFSAVLVHAVWLRTSWTLAATSLPLALPRGLAIGWAAARLAAPRPAPTPQDPRR
jgi:hypothetical protein